MSSARNRVMFTPSGTVLAAIERLAEVSRKPVARVVSEQLEGLVEHIHDLAAMLEEIEAGQLQAMEAVRLSAAEARATLQPAYVKATTALRELVEVANGAGPPSSNTGVTPATEQLSGVS